MASVLIESADQIFERAVQQLSENTAITNMSPGGIAREVLGIIASEGERQNEMAVSNMLLALSNGASGIYLDFVGDWLNLQRSYGAPARAADVDQIVLISAPSGQNFGSLNSGSEIRIPGGTSLLDSNGEEVMVTDGSVILAVADTSAYISAVAAQASADSSISAGRITGIDFEDYTAFPDSQLVVTNVSAINNGSSDESDEVFRYRLSNAILDAEAGNETSIRLAALNVPGVADIAVLNTYRGLGTVDIIIDSTTGEKSPLLEDSVSLAVRRRVASGTSFSVRSARTLGLRVVVTPIYNRGATLAAIEEADVAIREAVVALVAKVRMGGGLTINEIATAIINSHAAINDIGRPNNPLDEVTIWKESSVYGFSPRYTTDENIELEVDERLVLQGTPVEAVEINR